MRRPPRLHDDDRNDVDGHRNDDNDDDNYNHRGAVETNTGESNGSDCYLSLFDNTKVQYVVEVMV